MMAGKPSSVPAMTPEELAGMHAHMEALHKDLAESGELVDAQGLTAPAHARRVTLNGGSPVVTDGPYPETAELLAGYTIVDCASFDRATEIAARFIDSDGDPHPRFGRALPAPGGHRCYPRRVAPVRDHRLAADSRLL
jgi:hypothetical protein